jgi:hypothetical protein
MAEEDEGEHRVVDCCPAVLEGIEELVVRDGRGVVDVPAFVVVAVEAEAGLGEGNAEDVEGDDGSNPDSERVGAAE